MPPHVESPRRNRTMPEFTDTHAPNHRIWSTSAGPLPVLVVRKMLPSTVPMNAEALYHSAPSVADAENWLALGTGALLLIVGASAVPRRHPSVAGRSKGHAQPDSTRAALAGCSMTRRYCPTERTPSRRSARTAKPLSLSRTSIGTAVRSSRWARAPNCVRRAGSIRHDRTGTRTPASSSPPTPHR
jgi:hypothetical protein